MQDTSNDGKSQLDIYLSKATLVGGDDLDALQYWKLNKHRFCEVARMACDILSISITTMPSKSSLSIGGCIYNKYIKCLHLENVQTIICTHNWLHGYEEFGDLGNFIGDFYQILMFLLFLNMYFIVVFY